MRSVYERPVDARGPATLVFSLVTMVAGLEATIESRLWQKLFWAKANPFTYKRWIDQRFVVTLPLLLSSWLCIAS